jgi:hypothetical protein
MGGLTAFMQESGLPTRVANCLQNECPSLGWQFPPTKEQVASIDDREWLRVPNFGRLSLAQLRAWQNGTRIPKQKTKRPNLSAIKDLERQLRFVNGKLKRYKRYRDEAYRHRDELDAMSLTIMEQRKTIKALQAVADAPEGAVLKDVIAWLEKRGYVVRPIEEGLHAVGAVTQSRPDSEGEAASEC